MTGRTTVPRAPVLLAVAAVAATCLIASPEAVGMRVTPRTVLISTPYFGQYTASRDPHRSNCTHGGNPVAPRFNLTSGLAALSSCSAVHYSVAHAWSTGSSTSSLVGFIRVPVRPNDSWVVVDYSIRGVLSLSGNLSTCTHPSNMTNWDCYQNEGYNVSVQSEVIAGGASHPWNWVSYYGGYWSLNAQEYRFDFCANPCGSYGYFLNPGTTIVNLTGSWTLQLNATLVRYYSHSSFDLELSVYVDTWAVLNWGNATLKRTSFNSNVELAGPTYGVSITSIQVS